MAITSFGTNDFQTQTQWAEGTDAEVLKKTWFMDFAGPGKNYLVEKRTNLEKNAGDNIRYSLRKLDTTAPLTSGAVLEGNEDSIDYFGDTLVIEQSRAAARFEATMSAQRAAINLREDGRDQVSDKLSNSKDLSFFNQIAGYNLTGGIESSFRGHNALTAPSSAQHIFAEAGISDDQSLTVAGTFDINNLDVAIEKAKTQDVPIRPAHIPWMNQSLYVCFIHPFQMTSLRASSTVFETAMANAMRGGAIADNPMFAGTSVVWNGCLVVESTRVPTGLNSGTQVDVPGVRRAIFCGAQAASMAYGKAYQSDGRYSWVERDFDYNNEYGVAATCVFGIKKNVFDSVDFATIVISSTATASSGS